jgi:uncharacterized protein DUF6444/transposase IS66 family protein
LVEEQAQTIEKLTARIEELGRNSRNSSQFPSADGPAVPNRAACRRRSGRRPGKRSHPAAAGGLTRIGSGPSTPFVPCTNSTPRPQRRSAPRPRTRPTADPARDRRPVAPDVPPHSDRRARRAPPPARPTPAPTCNLLQRLAGRDEQVLLFARDLAVPFPNNQAEHDLRPTKTQLKISGCHRSADTRPRGLHTGNTGFARVMA